MIYLLGSIVFTSYLTLFFKVTEKLKISSFQTIVSNYFTCVLTGIVVNGSGQPVASALHQPWFPWAVAMGMTFVCLFNLVALVTVRFGVAVASVTNKLSVVIPFVFSIYLYHEPLGILKIAGMTLAIAAVILSCYQQSGEQSVAGKRRNLALLAVPFLLFAGSGCLDTMIKYVEQAFLNDVNYNLYLVTAFFTAGITGFILTVIFVALGRQQLSIRALLAGICLGIPNYFSIWCLLKALKIFPGKSSPIIPVNNMGIVLFSSLVAALVFQERLSLLNWLGVVLSIISIALITYA